MQPEREKKRVDDHFVFVSRRASSESASAVISWVISLGLGGN